MPDQALVRADRLLRTAHPRALLGITGAPGAGKSTLAQWLAAELGQAHPGQVAVLGMDGFHLAGAVLERRGSTGVKGAPETFDGHGYLALLRRLRAETDRTVYGPVFHREVEDSVAGELEISPAVRLVVTEGNYLLLDTDPWASVRGALDECWFVESDERVRCGRLVARHEAYGVAPEAARARAYGPDQDNAVLVAATRGRADLVVSPTG